MENYSQNDEQEYILDFFKDEIGTFLDVGAADGVTFSNVYQLLLNGWSGVSVEPDTKTVRDLLENYKQFESRSEILVAVIDPVERFVKFCENGQLSSTSLDHIADWDWHKQKYQYEWVPITHRTTTLNSVLSYYKDHNFSFISVDLEGQNRSVVTSTDWNLASNCKLICIEHDQNPEPLIEYMQQFGYELYHKTLVNILLSR